MLKNKYIKLTAVSSLLLLVIGFTISELEVKGPVKRQVATSLLNSENEVNSDSQNSDLDESTSRVYFSIFKFIGNIVPAGSAN